jgi:hypothetical protein
VRGPLGWIAAILVGIVAVVLVTAAIGWRDDRDETVSAGEWAQSMCGTFGVWRAQMQAIVEDIRTPPAFGGPGTEEPQSETPQGRTGFVRAGLERAIDVTETMIEGVENAGTPDTPNGEEVAQLVADFAEGARDDLEEAQDSLDEQADSLEEAVEQVADAVGALGAVLVSGVQTDLEIIRTDPELAAAFRDSSTCQELRQETQP